MSSRNAGAPDAVVALAPKANGKSATGDTLDKAGQAILSLLNRAASSAEANYQQVTETGRKLSAQLRGAEDRLRELEAQVQHYQDRADRAEKWLYQISVEIEQKFIGRDKAASR
jgi:chromosome segregation ATPase